MKLSALVDYLERIQQVPLTDIRTQALDHLYQLRAVVGEHQDIRIESHLAGVERDTEAIDQQFRALESTVETIKRQVKAGIKQLEPYCMSRSFHWFQKIEANMLNSAVLSRQLVISDDIRHRIAASIGTTQSWCWPGMIVRPGQETFIDGMTALDPLYLVDTDLDLLKPALERFNELYQRRLACYQIQENLGTPILSTLPQGQMGICVLFFYLNFRPIEIIYQWLDELWLLLRPGGRVLMTYNDCDHAHGVRLYESGYMCYTPGRLIREHATGLGFEILQDWHPNNDVSWLELRRPGELHSLRATQTLAKIVARSK